MTDCKPETLTPAQIQRALFYYCTQSVVADWRGTSTATISNRSDDWRRQHGGILTPNGWLYCVPRGVEVGWIDPARVPPEMLAPPKLPIPDPATIEAALSSYLTAKAVQDRLGITRAALHKRKVEVHRDMGGVQTGYGWIYEPERLARYAPLRGRPTKAEERRLQAAMEAEEVEPAAIPFAA